METGDEHGALYMLEVMAREGDAGAMVEAGVIYEVSKDISIYNMRKAITWYECAAAKKNVGGVFVTEY